MWETARHKKRNRTVNVKYWHCTNSRLEEATSAWNNLNIVLPDKKGYLPKFPKSELAQVLKTYLPKVSSEVSGAEISFSLIIDFMAYSRKVPSRKLLLKTYGDLVRRLWATFQRLSLLSERIDIIFVLCLDRSIKEGERKRKSHNGVAETTILELKQSLLVETEKFWGSSSNKI